MKLNRESVDKKKKPAKHDKKHHDHIPTYMKDEMRRPIQLSDLFKRK